MFSNYTCNMIAVSPPLGQNKHVWPVLDYTTSTGLPRKHDISLFTYYKWNLKFTITE